MLDSDALIVGEDGSDGDSFEVGVGGLESSARTQSVRTRCQEEIGEEDEKDRKSKRTLTFLSNSYKSSVSSFSPSLLLGASSSVSFPFPFSLPLLDPYSPPRLTAVPPIT